MSFSNTTCLLHRLLLATCYILNSPSLAFTVARIRSFVKQTFEVYIVYTIYLYRSIHHQPPLLAKAAAGLPIVVIKPKVSDSYKGSC